MTINRIGYKEAKKNIMERTHTRSYQNKFDLKNPMEFPTMTPNTTKAQELIGEWQNPLSDRNKFDNLIKSKNEYKTLINQILKNMEAENKLNPQISAIKNIINVIEGSFSNQNILVNSTNNNNEGSSGDQDMG